MNLSTSTGHQQMDKKQKRERLARNLPIDVVQRLRLKLNPTYTCGQDWKAFAIEIGMKYDEVANIGQKEERFTEVWNFYRNQDHYVTHLMGVFSKIKNNAAVDVIRPFEFCFDDEQASGNTRNVKEPYELDLFNKSSYTYNEDSAETLKKAVETSRDLAKCVRDLVDENMKYREQNCRLLETVSVLQNCLHGCECRNRVTLISKNQFESYDPGHKNAVAKDNPTPIGPPIECKHAAKSTSNEYQDRRENYRQEDATAATKADEKSTFGWTTTILIGCSLIKCSEGLKIKSGAGERIDIKLCLDASADDIKSYADPSPNCIILHVAPDVLDEYGKSYVDKAVEIIALAKSVTKIANNNIQVSVSGLILRCDEHDPTRARMNFILRDSCAAEKWYYFDHPNICPNEHLDESKTRLNSAGIEILAKNFLRAAQLH